MLEVCIAFLRWFVQAIALKVLLSHANQTDVPEIAQVSQIVAHTQNGRMRYRSDSTKQRIKQNKKRNITNKVPRSNRYVMICTKDDPQKRWSPKKSLTCSCTSSTTNFNDFFNVEYEAREPLLRRSPRRSKLSSVNKCSKPYV